MSFEDSGFAINKRPQAAARNNFIPESTSFLAGDSLALNTSFNSIGIEPPQEDPELLILPWIILAGLMLIPKSAGRKAEQSSAPVDIGLEGITRKTNPVVESENQSYHKVVESMAVDSFF